MESKPRRPIATVAGLAVFLVCALGSLALAPAEHLELVFALGIVCGGVGGWLVNKMLS